LHVVHGLLFLPPYPANYRLNSESMHLVLFAYSFFAYSYSSEAKTRTALEGKGRKEEATE
jgi:hypothetical protein